VSMTSSSRPSGCGKELEQFFVTVIEMTDKTVHVDGWEVPDVAEKVIDKAAQSYIRGCRVRNDGKRQGSRDTATGTAARATRIAREGDRDRKIRRQGSLRL
jgi:hypothetical protein